MFRFTVFLAALFFASPVAAQAWESPAERAWRQEGERIAAREAREVRRICGDDAACATAQLDARERMRAFERVAFPVNTRHAMRRGGSYFVESALGAAWDEAVRQTRRRGARDWAAAEARLRGIVATRPDWGTYAELIERGRALAR